MVPLDVRVLYGDTDQMGVVYYANYLRYFEAGRGEFLRARGMRYGDVERLGFRLPVIEAQLTYRQPARYDDVLTVETELVQAKAASVRFTYRVVCGDKQLVTGQTVHACVNTLGRPTRLPRALAELAAAA